MLSIKYEGSTFEVLYPGTFRDTPGDFIRNAGVFRIIRTSGTADLPQSMHDKCRAAYDRACTKLRRRIAATDEDTAVRMGSKR